MGIRMKVQNGVAITRAQLRPQHNTTQHNTPPLNDNTFKIRWGEDAKDEIFIPAIPKLNYEVQVV